MKKRFDRALYDKYDQLAKNGAIRYLATDPVVTEIRPHTSRYGADIEYIRDGQPGTLEAEMKVVWKGGPFPYPNVNVLCRKTKYFKDGTNFFMMAANGMDHLFITAEDILSSGIEEVANKYVYAGEAFYKVPLEKAKFGTYVFPVDSAPPVCEACGIWAGYTKIGEHWCCMKCGEHGRS